VEVQPPPQSAEDVWVAGAWNWDNQKYTWQAGRYTRPPQPGAVWVAARYDRQRSARKPLYAWAMEQANPRPNRAQGAGQCSCPTR
jgi:hypothetical protein